MACGRCDPEIISRLCRAPSRQGPQIELRGHPVSFVICLIKGVISISPKYIPTWHIISRPISIGCPHPLGLIIINNYRNCY